MWVGTHVETTGKNGQYVIRQGLNESLGELIASKTSSQRKDRRVQLAHIGSFYSIGDLSGFDATTYANEEGTVTHVWKYEDACKWELGDLIISLYKNGKPVVLQRENYHPIQGYRGPSNRGWFREHGIEVKDMWRVFGIHNLENIGELGVEIREKIDASWNNYQVPLDIIAKVEESANH